MATAQLLPERVSDAHRQIAPYIHKTPVLSTATMSLMTGRCMYLKAENLQKTGSFKARGALNAVTHSSGNHGQALAYAARTLCVPCKVVVPKNAPQPKVDSIRKYGAEVVFCEPSMKARVETCEEIMKSTGEVLVHPHDDLDVMAGQLDALFVPVGGGGLAAGIACWAKSVNPSVRVYCVEPAGKRLAESLKVGSQESVDPSALISTVADGLRVPRLGKRCFPLVQSFCEKIIFSVNDEEIVKAMKLTFERTKLVIEPSSAAVVAAALREGCRLPEGATHVGLVLSGGNVDLDKLPWMNH